MLPGFMSSMVMAGADAANFTYTANGIYVGSVSSPTMTFTGVDFGVAASDRIVVASFGVGGGTGRTVSSATIGGIAATILGTATNQSSINAQTIYAAVPTGTSGTIVVNWSGGSINGAAPATLGCWSIYGCSSGAHDAFAGAINANVTGARSVACNVPAGGVQLAYVYWGSAGRTTVWSNAVESFDASDNSTAEFSPGAGASNSASATPSASSSSNMWAVSFGP